MKAFLILEDGSVFSGESFGFEANVSGEVVFATGMVGYPESLTDPSYEGQILVFTYPLIGNYGVPDTSASHGVLEHFESGRIHTRGIVVADYSYHPHHWQSFQSLSEWLVKENIPGIHGVDTRALTKKLREYGTMLGKIVFTDAASPAESSHTFQPNEVQDPNTTNLVADVSCKTHSVYGKGDLRIAVVDCGCKNGIIRSLVSRGVEVHCIPYDYDFNNSFFDGVVISNGPGNPLMCSATIKHIRKALDHDTPVFGICLGNQLLGLAAGASTYKLRYGHRSQNQPCLELGTKRCSITSQNHGYAVDAQTLPPDWEEWLVNANDGTNEGIRHRSKPFFSVQFHPEATPGPVDTAWLFDRFIAEAQSRKAPLSGAHKHILPPSSAMNANLNPNTKPKKVLLLGSGALKIGEAGEFDYSGSQCIKALKEDGIFVVLINPNIATYQTSEGLADRVYFLPVTPYFVEKVIEKEKPDSIILSFGGQTALSCGLSLAASGALERHRLRVLGTPIEAIERTEDREKFAKLLGRIGVKTPASFSVRNIEDSLAAAKKIEYPVMMRSGFSLGGLGSGKARNADELSDMAQRALAQVPQILIEESVHGWKEVEYEVVRDAFDNCITVCNMENMDPMGIHTGESIVVAPSQTLTNTEYHYLREISIKVIRELKIVGECNIQFALCPESLDYRVIEVNARLSRSSALASKATGYPLAFVATKLSLGYSLPEIPNSITRVTKACFEPSLDYVVVKIPRWDFHKFREVRRQIGSEMKSVGEVMAIGRSFEEALQKAARMINVGIHGLSPNSFVFSDLEEEISNPTDMRLYAIAEAFRQAFSVSKLYSLSSIDPWFLHKIQGIVEYEKRITTEALTAPMLRKAKQLGFSDAQIASLKGMQELEVRKLRKEFGIIPFVKQIDTLGAEYPACTNYLYLTYNGSEHDITFASHNAVVVLGSGAYSIGSSVEFDWCCVNAVSTAKRLGYATIMINYNPETVSTDYDTCDKLYFDELSFERVLDIYELEQPHGLIVSMGGQVPNGLALKCMKAHVAILGTSPTMIDTAEDRHKFSKLLDSLGIDQPAWKELTSVEEAQAFARGVGYPVLVRPSYVLSGAAMSLSFDDTSLAEYLQKASSVTPEHPVVISKFIDNAKEIEFDAVAQHGEVVVYAITEHVENAGVHSGDATMVLPTQKTYSETLRRIKHASRSIAKALDISGPFNIQFLAKGNRLKVIECNLRASRSFPFVSKVFKRNFIDIATRVILGQHVAEHIAELPPYVGVKAPQFSFFRLKGADPISGVEMASTGEVACFGEDAEEAFLKAMISTGFRLPQKSILLTVGGDEMRYELLDSVLTFHYLGFNLYGTEHTSLFFQHHGIPVQQLYKIHEPLEPNIASAIKQGKIDLVISIPDPRKPRDSQDKIFSRRFAVEFSVPLLSNLQLVKLFSSALASKGIEDLAIKHWGEYRI